MDFLPAWMNYAVLALIALTVLFAALKLLGVIAWPWWAVCLPLLGPLGAGALALLAVIVWSASGSH
jgi:hypothetical protein